MANNGIEITVKADNTQQVLSEFKSAVKKALEECGLTGENYAKSNCPVDTGSLRNSITHKVVEGENSVYIGTDSTYGAYVELGTGIYATQGGGRSTPWVYQDGRGEFHRTNGMRAQPYLKPAIADHSSNYRSIIESTMKNG